MIIEMHIMQIVIVTVVPAVMAGMLGILYGWHKGYSDAEKDRNFISDVISGIEKALENDIEKYKDIISN